MITFYVQTVFVVWCKHDSLTQKVSLPQYHLYLRSHWSSRIQNKPHKKREGGAHYCRMCVL